MSDQLQGKRIAILVANEGVEQVELTSPSDALREAGADLDLLAPEEDEIQAFNHLMPPRGVKKGTKRARQYEHVKKSEKEAGRSEDRAEEITARAVNKEKARFGESKTSSRSSTRARSASSRG